MVCFSFNISLFFLYSTKKGPGGTFYNTVFHFIIIYYYINNIVAHTMKSCWLHLLCLVVVLPPLPGGEEGEIYDDVVDPNLEVRWELVLLFKKQVNANVKTLWKDSENMTEEQIITSLVGFPVPSIPGLLWSPAASCGCLTETDALPALKCKIHSVVRLTTDLLSTVVNP